MLRLMSLLLLSSLLIACASTSPESAVLGSSYPLASPDATPSPASPLPVPQRRGDDRDDYVMLKGGFYGPDEGALDDGYIANLALGRYFTQALAFELELGYLESEGDTASLIDTLRGVPMMANARLTVPIWFLEAHGGGGVGAIYYDIDGVFTTLDTDGWLFAGNFFLGADVVLADAISLGVEAKYYLTEELGSGDLDAFAAFATLSIRY